MTHSSRAITAALAAGSLILTAGFLSGCSTKAKPVEAPASSAPAAPATTVATATPGPAKAPKKPAASTNPSAPAAAKKGTPVNVTVNDEGEGIKVTVLEYVRGLTPPPPAIAANGQEMVLIHVSVDQTGALIQNPFTSDATFKFSANGSIGQGGKNDVTVAWMKDNGYPMLPDVKGKSKAEGWVPGYVKKDATGLKVTYSRLGGTTLDGKTIPKFEQDIPLG